MRPVRGQWSGWRLAARAIIACGVALGTTATAAGPAGAVTRQGWGLQANASTPAQGFPESHLWTFGENSILGFRFPTPQPLHGLPAGQHVTGVAVRPSDYTPVFLLGDGTAWFYPTFPATTPSQVAGLAGITALAAAGSTIYALSGTGAVYAWSGSGSATQVTGVANVTSVVNGYALESDGTVWALGGASPVQVDVPATVTQISSNPCGGSSYALTSSGQIYAWGTNNVGQLGDGTFTNSAIPVLVRRVSTAAQVIGGCFDAYAIIKPKGTVMAWGMGSQGELGSGHRYISAVPVAVSKISGVISLTAGYQTTYAVTKNGIAWAWGFGLTAQLGFQPKGCPVGAGPLPAACYSAVPVKVPGIGARVAYIAASDTIYTEQNYAVAVGQNGSLWGPWGGLQRETTPSHQVTRVPSLKPATGFWLNPFGGLGWGYSGAAYIAN